MFYFTKTSKLSNHGLFQNIPQENTKIFNFFEYTHIAVVTTKDTNEFILQFWENYHFKEKHDYKIHIAVDSSATYICDLANRLVINNKTEQDYAQVFMGLPKIIAVSPNSISDNIYIVDRKNSINGQYLIPKAYIPMGIIVKSAQNTNIEHIYFSLDKFFNDGNYQLNILNNKVELKSNKYTINRDFYDLNNFTEKDAIKLQKELLEKPAMIINLKILCNYNMESAGVFIRKLKNEVIKFDSKTDELLSILNEIE